jgi:thymidylate synthase ThyX
MFVVNPEKELVQVVEDRIYAWRSYAAEDTGLKVITLLDRGTGLELASIIPNEKRRVAAHRAWIAARHSRSPGSTVEIAVEMGEKGVNPDEKLDEMFRGYGHASVADMARMDVHFNNCPMHVPMTIFNYGVINSGQEKSTRYQKRFGKSVLQPLGQMLQGSGELIDEYDGLGSLSLQLFERQRNALTSAFERFFQPQTPAEKKSLDARVLDCARYFLLLGQGTGFAFETSARDFARLISRLKASRLSYYQDIGVQLETLLSPQQEIEAELGFLAEARSLMFDTKADMTVRNTLVELEEYLQRDILDMIPRAGIKRPPIAQAVFHLGRDMSSAEKMVSQYVLSVWPHLNWEETFEYVRSLPRKKKEDISRIIFSSHNHVKELPELASTKEVTLVMEGYLGELRDFNRHRAWSRFIQLPSNLYANDWTRESAEGILSQGFGIPAYLDLDVFSKERQGFVDEMNRYYEAAGRFIDSVHRIVGPDVDHAFVQNILPLAHRVNLWMHGDPKQASYLSHLRVRPGGHINYRLMTFDAAKLITESDPYLSGLRMEKRPDPGNRDEFFLRS